MDLSRINRIFFVGIGGIGMSALARHFHQNGYRVSGYDKTKTDLTGQLAQEGITITYEDKLDALDEAADLVIFTPAIPKDHAQLNYYLDHDFAVHKRAEVLGWLTNKSKGLAVAGSHGKTSTSAMLNHILQTAQYSCAAFLGGISLNYNSNYIHGNEWCIAEADEFDRSFHQLHPQGAIITSVDTDHLDVYGNYEAIKNAFTTFAGQVKHILIHHESVPTSVADQSISTFSYGWSEKADFYATNISIEEGSYIYNIVYPEGKIEGVTLNGGGRHNVENSIGAFALAYKFGIEPMAIKEAIASYQGVQRRFQIHIQSEALVYIDDYAHHPKEIEVTLATARELFPGRNMTVVFQPHLFSRTNDLKEGLAKSLSIADEVLLLDIYPAREKPMPGVTSEVIYRLLTNSAHLVPKNQVITRINELKPELLLTIGAGDIDTLIQPVIKNYKKS